MSEIEEAIKIIKEELLIDTKKEYSDLFSEEMIKNLKRKDTAIETVLQDRDKWYNDSKRLYIENEQQKQKLEQKDKIIDKMAYEIDNYQLQDSLVCGTIQDTKNCDRKCKECIKKYFEEEIK